MVDISNPQSRKWKSMEGLPIPREDLEELLGHLEARNINPRRGEDSLIWEPSKTGQYNSKDGYKILTSSQEWVMKDLQDVYFAKPNRSNPGPFGIGYVIRDQTGAIIRKMVKPIPPDTNNIADFTALLLGLKDCINHDIKNVSVEGDSEIAVNAIRKKIIPNWRLQALLERILENLNSLEHFEAKHIYREANEEADALSKVASQGTFVQWWSQGF
ncbi:uncharacterized protein LOC131856954 [Cryptomeria japonica]|uniref:uncharacterized protein LOC131856954 n=1 Tax=Cryptomeria japonica TaxID=3369 RepID=UPI0027DA58B6|nr:uncharacterized protein LOC131856954 [Cryptomeria japonica]